MPGPERSFVVTGGAGGIGRAIAARLDGHVVVLDVVDGEDAADEAGRYSDKAPKPGAFRELNRHNPRR